MGVGTNECLTWAPRWLTLEQAAYGSGVTAGSYYYFTSPSSTFPITFWAIWVSTFDFQPHTIGSMALAYLQLLNYCIALAVNISSPMRALLVFPIKSHGNEVMNELDPKRGQRGVRSWVVGAPTLLECVTRVSHCLGARGGGGLSWGGKGGRRSWWESAGEDVEVWIVELRTGSVHLSLNWGRPIWKPVNFAIFQYLQIFWGVSFYENIHDWSRSRKDVDDDKRQRWLMARSRLRGRAD